ncbi:MAG: galactokinase [Anaerolineae bacterium]
MACSDLVPALEHTYGQEPDSLSRQETRYRCALDTFYKHFGPGDISIYHAPGRLNLIGEHTDYNHGYVLPVALDKDVLLVCRPRRDNLVNLFNTELEFPARSFALSREIPMAPVGDWANYAQGAGQWLQTAFNQQLLGFDALVDGAAPTGTPRGAGLSSSSALTVVTTTALVDFNQLSFGGAPLAAACSQAEWYVGTRGGIMDHFSSVLGHRGQALFLDCRPTSNGEYRFEHVPLPDGYTLMIVESGIKHRNTGPHFNRRVAEGRIGVRLLQERYPGISHLRDIDQRPWAEIEPLLPDEISSGELVARGIDPEQILDHGVSPQTDTFFVRRRCRHVISENARVRQCVVALKAGDMVTVGGLLHAAHRSASDDYDISTPEIETLITLAEAQTGCLGARLTGAGWGGCILAIVRTADAESFSQLVPAAYKANTGLEAQVFACRSAAGAGLVYRGRI